jgi:oligoendopeptidase F
MEKKWNLEPILKIKDFDGLYSELEKDLDKMRKYVDELKPEISLEKFKEILEFSEISEEKMGRLGGLPGLMEAIDQKDAEAKLLKSKAENLALKWSEVGIKMSLWWKGKREPYLNDKNAKRIFGVITDLEYGLKRSRLLAKYSLQEREENIIVNKDTNGLGVLGELREMMQSEMEYEIEIKGKKKRIKTQSELLALVYDPREEVRRAAYGALLKKQKENLPKFFAIYQAVVKDWAYETKLRGYKNAITVRNLANDVPDKAVEELLKSCSKNKDIFQDFFRWKAKELGKEKLERSDVYAPIAKKERKYTIPETKELVLSSLSKFSDKFYSLGKELIEGQQIDWEPKVNKRSGAFCATISPKIKPYIMLNFTGKQRDVSTLAHEVGHGIHSMYASGHYPSAQNANLPLAETASTLAEMILFEEMLLREKDGEIKKSLLADKMADSYATILRQNYFILFEKEAHEKVPKGMTAENLSSLYFQNLKDQFDGSVTLSPDFRYEWSYISHIFESPFYCYAYNFGELLSLGLLARYKENPGIWRKKIEIILEAGGSRNPEEVLKSVGINILSSGFFQESFEIIANWQEQLTKVR